MITFNNIITALENFANNHFFIKSFGHGNIEEIDLDKYTLFPLLHVIYVGSTYDDGTKTYRFEIYIVDNPSDKIDKISYQREVISDSEQCAEDLLADLTNGGQIFGFWDYELTNATITPLEEETKNVLSGVVLDIEIQVPYQYDSCNAPLTGVTPTDSCADADVQVNGNAYGSVASGSFLNVLVRYVNGTPIGTIVGNVVEIPNPIICDDVDIEVNGVAYGSEPSGGTFNVDVENTLNAPVGSLVSGVWQVPDGDINVNSIPYSSVPSDGSANVVVENTLGNPVGNIIGGDWQVPDGDIQVNSVAYGSVPSDGTTNVVVENTLGTLVGSLVGGDWQVANASVVNSDATYSGSVVAEGSLTLPDITITDQNGSTASYPSVKNFDIRTLNSGILYRAPLYTQKTSYNTGDEGNNMSNGVYDYTPPLYPDVIQDLDYTATAANVYYTLKFNNSFGNKFRFTNGAGADLSGAGASGIIIDHLYNLMWWGTNQGIATSWSNAFTLVSNANAALTGGFGNWRLPSKGEWWSILEEHNASTAFRNPFSNWPTALYWTSTTNPATTTQALSVFNGRLISTSAKTTNTLRVVLVRKYS
jgi:hypothetical protein